MPDDDGNQDDRDDAGLTPAERRILQDKAKRADDLQTELTAVRQQLAIRDAGLELSAKQLKALEATHEGEWTPDAIRASAVDLGFAEPKAPPPAVAADEQDTQRRIAAAANGADSSTSTTADAEMDSRLGHLYAEVKAGRMSAETASREFDEIYRTSGRPLNQH